MRPSVSGIVLFFLFLLLLGILYATSDAIFQAHIDESIRFLSSDGYVYFRWYEERFRDANIVDDWYELRRSTPVVFLILADGDLRIVQIANLGLMFLTMRTALNCLPSLGMQMTFLFLTLIFPYYSFGFLSLNKEIYAMCSAVFFGCYLIRGNLHYLIVSLILALCARYFMFIAMFLLIILIPRTKEPRYFLALIALVAISVAGPMLRIFVPDYTGETLADNGGAMAVIMDGIIQNYGYAPLYPFKYIVMMLLRPYGYVIGGTHDAIGAVVSVLSLLALGLVAWILLSGRDTTPVVRRLIAAGLIAPIPLMWSEITHWRYYSFVYFFFLFAIVLQFGGAASALPQSTRRHLRRNPQSRSAVVPAPKSAG